MPIKEITRVDCARDTGTPPPPLISDFHLSYNFSQICMIDRAYICKKGKAFTSVIPVYMIRTHMSSLVLVWFIVSAPREYVLSAHVSRAFLGEGRGGEARMAFALEIITALTT